MENLNPPTGTQKLELGLEDALSSLSIRASSSSWAHNPSVPTSSSTRRRRLATTRGFGNPGRGGSYTNTPETSPTKFNPEFESTPLNPVVPAPVSGAVPRSVQLPHHPPLTPGVIQASPGPTESSSQPVPSARPSVISPRIIVEQPSLDWDNYTDSPSYKPSSATPAGHSLQISDCLREVQGITGIEDVRKVTLVDTSVSSLSSLGAPMHQPSPQQKSMMSLDQNRDARILENMKVCVEEMMEDFTAEDVREANVEEAHRILENISKARTEFRTKCREYKQDYQVSSNAQQWLDSSIATMNQTVKAHAHAVWTRMEQIKSSQNLPSTNAVASANTAPPPSSSRSQDDLQYKRNVYRDQYLFLTESLSLPDDDETIIGEYWGNKSESEVCRGMQQLSDWQKSV